MDNPHTQLAYPTLSNKWFIESLGTLSTKSCNTLRYSVTNMHVAFDHSFQNGIIPKYRVTLVFEDSLDGTVSNAISRLIFKPHVGVVRIGIGDLQAPSNYLEFSGCVVQKYDFKLDYADPNTTAKHIVEILFDTYTRTLD